MDWFSQDFELVSLNSGLFQQIGSGGLSGEEQNFAGGERLPYANGGLDPVHIGHDHVADDQVGLDLLGALYGPGPSVDRRSVEAILVKNNGQRIGDYTFIIYYQNSRFGRKSIN